MRITLLTSLITNIILLFVLWSCSKRQSINRNNDKKLLFNPWIKQRRRSLTHLIITFNDYNKVSSLIKDHWTNYPPCNNHTNVTLILENAYAQHYINISEVENHPMVKKCFKEIKLVFANTPVQHNNHDDGSRILLERILDNSILLDNPYYILNIEPDVYPVKPYWLDYLVVLCDGGAGKEDWWILGSPYMSNIYLRSIKKGFLELGFHICGNAVLNVSEGSGLKEFYFGKFKEYQRSGKVIKEYPTYDIAIAEMLMNVKETWNWTRHIAHKVKYSEYILNMYGKRFSIKNDGPKYPKSFLLHKARLAK